MVSDLWVYYPADALKSDHSYCGIGYTEIAGEILVFGDVCYPKNDGKFWKSDANAVGTMPVTAMALGSISADVKGNFLESGMIRDDSWSWTVGGLVYASLTTGALTQDISGYTTGDQVQVAGVAFKSNILLFRPGLEIVEIA